MAPLAIQLVLTLLGQIFFSFFGYQMFTKWGGSFARHRSQVRRIIPAIAFGTVFVVISMLVRGAPLPTRAIAFDLVLGVTEITIYLVVVGILAIRPHLKPDNTRP